MLSFKRRVTNQKITIAPTDFATFRIDFAARKSWYGNRLFVSAWVVEKDSDGSLSVVVSEGKPPEVAYTERSTQADESLAESRRDTLWGDLKVVAKRVSRDAAHTLSHMHKKYGGEFGPTRRAKFVGLAPEKCSPVAKGNRYQFEIDASDSSRERNLVRFPVIDLCQDPGTFVSYQEIVSDDRRILKNKAVAGLCVLVAMPLSIIVGKMFTNSEPVKTTSAERFAGQIPALPKNLIGSHEGCPPNARPIYTLVDDAYSAFCLDADGLLFGQRMRWWKKSGKKFREETGHHGQLVGPAKTWDERGRISIEENFGNGHGLDGETRVYDHEEGRVIVERWSQGKKLSSRSEPLKSMDRVK